jgi:SulP family sulfate permease
MQDSQFSPFDPTRPRNWRNAFPVALEGAGFGIPVTVGSVALLFNRIDPQWMAAGLLAALLGLALMHLLVARSGRPMVHAVRVMEVTMMLGFLDHFIAKMPGWGLPDTPANRLMLVMAVTAGAALILPLGYALRLQRFARMIPAPVFAGFSTALAITLWISQIGVLWTAWPAEGAWFPAIALIVLGVAIAAERWLRGWPPGLVGMIASSLAAAAVAAAGWHVFGAVKVGSLQATLPVSLVDWSALWATQVNMVSLLRDVVLASSTLALLVFLNTIVNEEAVNQMDERRATPLGWVRVSLGQIAASFMGSPLITAAIGPTRAAVRVGWLDWRAMGLIAAAALAVLASGVLSLVPLAAVCGLLLYDGWQAFDRPSLAMAVRRLRGQPMVLSEREDLVTVGLVVASAVLFNMVIGVFVGVFAGLVLYAWRNGRRLARTVTTGMEVRSRCTRSAHDTALLATRADRVRFIVLEGALFFGAASTLQTLLREQSAPGHYIVVDWSNVVSADSTVARSFIRAAADSKSGGAQVAVSGIDGAGSQLADTLRAAGLLLPVFPDSDRALEWAENEVIAVARAGEAAQSPEGTMLQEALSLMEGLNPERRDAIEALFEQRFLRAGETVFHVGQRDSELMVILKGSVDVLVPRDEGHDIRLARIRRGAMLGELSFLDASARGATAVATEDLLLGVLTRERFDRFAKDYPEAGRQVLTNLALDLAVRLRRTNQMAVSSAR